MMRVVFAGGGTGGHLYPALAVVESLSRLGRDCNFEFWGTGRAVERAILDAAGQGLRVLPSAPVPRNPVRIPGFVWSLVSGYARARRLLAACRADAVVGLGGYSSFAPVLAGSRLGLATLLLEQNVVVGKANRRLAKRASAVCLSWEASRENLPPAAKAEVTGNPLRRAIVDAAREHTYDPSGSLVILGGSSGAVGLNTLVIESLDVIGGLGLGIVHQTGQADCARVKKAYEEAGVEGEVVPFVEDMAQLYASAGMVIARAGGTTLCEIALFGIPAILVPYPHHRDYHQMANARVFGDVGAAEIFEEKGADAKALGALLGETAGDQSRLFRMHAASAGLGRPDAADTVAGRILELVEEGRTGNQGRL